MATDLVVPKLGESIAEAIIAKWLKNVGEPIAADEPVVDLETDKVSVALPAPTSGVLSEQRYAVGATVKVGEVIGIIGSQAEMPIAPKPATAQQKVPEPPPAQASSTPPPPRAPLAAPTPPSPHGSPYPQPSHPT